MKTIKAIMFTGAFAASLIFSGCATSGSTTRPMETSSDVPAAQGTVNLSQTDNGNTKINLDVKHLARPDRVVSGATTYVVWAQPNVKDAPTQNIGALKVNKDLSGHLTAVVPYQNFHLFVTAEPSGAVTQPSGDKMLRTDVTLTAE